MTKALLAALGVVLSISMAHGQTNTPVTPVSVHAGYSPGTIGAMDEVAQGIATNPGDVAMQQTAHGISAGYSPGTVGATPGR